ncbi:hypothetical protein K493DRAFT_302243 [Basidiobolus meristosporus CBS 931.73]|uniref:Uncharacterized protein n=1 Tax=Basidiobolus meristosporus CBS 931.73 TaxID=1314790 RepID=A0A1Y1Y7X1_9FUNG|nr:hypothetical protein K493DRAFT_302243 [Basidiobolus meristosporus CBS 931.73]|eukprot:ORX94120.1 hypothetical protein K493DRAFT_302243 [Basidiobolus meristosporus CBS 931.73]
MARLRFWERKKTAEEVEMKLTAKLTNLLMGTEQPTKPPSPRRVRKLTRRLYDPATFKKVLENLKKLSSPVLHDHGPTVVEHQIDDDPERMVRVTLYWWGYEILLPTEFIKCLEKEWNRSFIVFSALVAIATVVPPIQPLVGIISAYVNLSFAFIYREDHGFGVILSATWALPLLMVPVGLLSDGSDTVELERHDSVIEMKEIDRLADSLILSNSTESQ